MILPTSLFLVGITLLYSAVKGMDPRDVVKNLLAGKEPDGNAAGHTKAEAERNKKTLIDPDNAGNRNSGLLNPNNVLGLPQKRTGN